MMHMSSSHLTLAFLLAFLIQLGSAQHVEARDAGPVRTLQMRSAPSAYVASGTASAIPVTKTLRGSELVIETSSSDGVNIYLSDGLRDTIHQIVEDQCRPPTSQSECDQKVADALDDGSVDLQARDFGVTVVAVSVIVALISVAIEGFRDHSREDPIPAAYSIGPQDIAQMTSAGSSIPSAVVVAQPSTTNTITQGPKALTATGAIPSFMTATSKSAGDVVLSLPGALAARQVEAQPVRAFIGADLLFRTNDLIFDLSVCPQGLSKRDDSLDCVAKTAYDLWINFMPGKALHDLALIGQRAPLLKDPRASTAASQVEEFASKKAFDMQIAPADAISSGDLAFALTYQVLVKHENLTNQIRFPVSDLAGVTVGPSTRMSLTSAANTNTTSANSTHCPTDTVKTMLICQSATCNGDIPKRTCVGGEWDRCDCTFEATPSWDMYNTTSADIQANVLQSVWTAILASTPTPTCYVQTAAKDFNGKPRASPTSWCACQQWPDAVHSLSLKNGSYPTLANQTGEVACAYTALPSSTLSIASVSATATPTAFSCRLESTVFTSLPTYLTQISTGIPYSSCTCNDGSQNDPRTSSRGTDTSTYCPGTIPYFSPSPTTNAVVVIQDKFTQLRGSSTTDTRWGMRSAAADDYFAKDKWCDDWNNNRIPLFGVEDPKRPGTVGTAGLPLVGDLQNCVYTSNSTNREDGGVLKCTSHNPVRCVGEPNDMPQDPKLQGVIDRKDGTVFNNLMPWAVCEL